MCSPGFFRIPNANSRYWHSRLPFLRKKVTIKVFITSACTSQRDVLVGIHLNHHGPELVDISAQVNFLLALFDLGTAAEGRGFEAFLYDCSMEIGVTEEIGSGDMHLFFF
jgi:hypothetical protein